MDIKSVGKSSEKDFETDFGIIFKSHLPPLQYKHPLEISLIQKRRKLTSSSLKESNLRIYGSIYK